MSDVEELTIHWEENGQVMVHERSKHILQDGSWATILFCYDERDRKTGEMHGPKFALRRYRSHGGKHHVHAKFVLTSEDQAKATAEILLNWIENPPATLSFTSTTAVQNISLEKEKEPPSTKQEK